MRTSVMTWSSGSDPSAGPGARRPRLRWIALLAAAALAGCATPPPRPPALDRLPATPAPEAKRVFMYPKAGQSTATQDRDRYECHVWAVKQSAYDPSAVPLASPPPPPRARVVAAVPPGHDTVGLAVLGAIVGGMLASPHHGAEGAVVGAILGAAAGAASDDAREARARELEAAYAARDAQKSGDASPGAAAYGRAITACLEARNYSVR